MSNRTYASLRTVGYSKGKAVGKAIISDLIPFGEIKTLKNAEDKYIERFYNG